MASQILRRIVDGAVPAEIIRRANAVIDMLNGNRPGRIKLHGDDGTEANPIGGASVSSGNYALDVKAASGLHGQFTHSTGSPIILAIADSGNVTASAINSGDVGVTGNLTFVGSVRRLKADLSNATISNRLLAQSSTTNGESRLGIIPNGTATKAGWAAYSSATPDNSHYVELLANATDNTIDLITSKAGTGTTRDVRLVVDTTVVAKIVAGTLALRLENTRWLAGYSTGSAEVNLLRLNGSNVIESGQTGTQHNLLGTVVAPLIDPPTVDGQVTNKSVCKAFYSGYVSGSSINDGAKYNFTSATYNAAGDYSIAWNRDFKNAFYTAVVTVEHGSARTAQINYSKSSGGLDVHIYNPATGLKADCDAFHVVAFGPLS